MGYSHTRRAVLTAGAVAAGSAILRPGDAAARALGAGRSEYGRRSKYERSERIVTPGGLPGTGSSRTPMQDLYGIITPSSLHFERHHSGVPAIDPTQHELLLHGLVERPLRFSMAELRRFPSVSRLHFIECGGNAGREQDGNPGSTVQLSHGLLSCSEWSGVSLSVLLREAGLKNSARWILAEGADAARHSRSIPLEKALDDVIVAYGQNGEAVRPEQGYPLRLVVPGCEGNVNVKWLHRLQVLDQPAMSRDEAASYTDLMPSGKAQRFTFEMETNSVITRPSGGQHLDGHGFFEITGLAWSGLGKIVRVEVSVDGGGTWRDAELQAPVCTKALTRFRYPWRWAGEETILQSRSTDETGYVQPTRDMLIAARGMSKGPDGFDHYHGIKPWRISRDGSVVCLPA
ncbi:MAG TPA: sulfite dehydrogenase [Steroidobacteraceae bacterium]|nr:sulfite dehydrogenase [Steroidobacteraceae bacterium]